MQLKSLNVYFFFLLLFLVGAVMFLIFQPFLTAIVAAAILAALFEKTYLRLKRRLWNSAGLSAALTCLLVVILIITPIFTTLSLAISEANALYRSVGEDSTLEKFVGGAVSAIQGLPVIGGFGSDEALNRDAILEDVRQFSRNFVGLLQAAYAGVIHFIFWIFIMFFTFFYFLIDGKRAVNYLMQMSPLRNEHDRLLIQKFVSISRATLKGTLVVGIVQGFIGALMLWIAGVPSPAIWGLIMMFLALIPLAGPTLIWLPAGLIMLSLGHVWQGVFILAVGAGLISTIDNVLRPKLVGRDTQLHPLLIFFATIGGIAFFGLPGFIIGPIIISLFMALGEIYQIEFRTQLKEYNS